MAVRTGIAGQIGPDFGKRELHTRPGGVGQKYRRVNIRDPKRASDKRAGARGGGEERGEEQFIF